MPKVNAGGPTDELFEGDDFYVGLKSRTEVTGTGESAYTTTRAYTLNSAGFPTRITEKRGEGSAREVLVATYGADPVRPSKVVRYKYDGPEDLNVKPSQTSTEVLTWNSVAPILQSAPSLEVVTNTDKETSTTKTTCETETRCSTTTDSTVKVAGSKEMEKAKLTFTGTFVAPKLLLLLEGQYVYSSSDKITSTIRSSFADGKWSGESTTTTSKTTPFVNPSVSPDAAAALKKVREMVTTGNCVLDANAVTNCTEQTTSDKVRFRTETSRKQKVVFLKGDIGSVEDLELESSSTTYDFLDPKKVDEKFASKSTYDANWRLTSRTDTSTREEQTYDEESKPTGKKTRTRISKTTYTYVGDSRRPATETRSYDGEQTAKVVYAY